MGVRRSFTVFGYGCLLALVGILSWLAVGRAQLAPAERLTAEQKDKNLEAFEYVWKTVRDKNWDPKLGGLDWQAVRDQYRPQIEKADTMDRCRELLNQMVHRLGQSHFQIVPGSVLQEIKGKNGKPRGPAGVPGIDVRVVDARALVVKVDPEAPAAKLGVRPGWQLVKVEGKDLAPVLAKVQQAYQKSRSLDFYLYRAVLARLKGNVGDKLPITFRDGADRELDLAVPLTHAKGLPAQLGNLPTIYVHFETRTLEPKIEYFFLSAFFDPERVMKAFEAAVHANRDADGFILDLRGNPGGIGFMAAGIGGWFITQPDLKLGTMSTRDTSLKFVLNPRAEPFTGPLAILVDGCSVSTSEILAGGMQDLMRAKVFGTNTAGAALPSLFERLPNGDGFQYAFADYVSAGGRRLEGAGVRPDVEVKLTREALLAGRDEALDAAVAWIRSEKKQGK